MAVAARRLPENAPGPFFVDDSCIDCFRAPSVAAMRAAVERLLRGLLKA